MNKEYLVINKLNQIKQNIRILEKKIRHLTKEEIELLKENNNYSTNWNQIFITPESELETIRNTVLEGKIILNLKKDSIIFNSILKNVTINGKVEIINSYIENYYISNNVQIISTGSIICERNTTFGNGVEISCGIETGGRELVLYAELDYNTSAEIVTRRNDTDLQNNYKKIVEEYLKNVKSEFGIILDNTKIKNTQEIKNAFIGEGTVIENATIISDSTIVSTEEESVEIRDGAYVKKSLIQWGSSVESMGIVEKSLLCEHSHVERHGKVTESVIGPNTGIGEGEVTASLVGPFVGFHHQALLIAAVWKDGKGNIGYGANVGSNHTGKAPDQEIHIGEGVFIGLGANIKFPSNFTNAPYTIIATGVTALPQKIDFPFSLINTPSKVFPDISPAFNEIFPAWVLSDNIYMIKRNEKKYKKRNKARRNKFVFEVFRKDIVELMIEARNRLNSIQNKKEVYLEKDIPGIGKNYLTEKSRLKGIEAYTFYIQYYALRQLYRRLLKLSCNGVKKLSWDYINAQTDDEEWEYAKEILNIEFKDEYSTIEGIKNLLHKYLEYESKIVENIKVSKEKDDRRGKRIIPDYEIAHTLAADDSFVKESQAELENLKKEFGKVISMF